MNDNDEREKPESVTRSPNIFLCYRLDASPVQAKAQLQDVIITQIQLEWRGLTPLVISTRGADVGIAKFTSHLYNLSKASTDIDNRT